VGGTGLYAECSPSWSLASQSEPAISKGYTQTLQTQQRPSCQSLRSCDSGRRLPPRDMHDAALRGDSEDSRGVSDHVVTARGPASAASLPGPCGQAPTNIRSEHVRGLTSVRDHHAGSEARCNLSDLVREKISGDAAMNDNIASLRRIGDPVGPRSQKRPAITRLILALASRSSRLSLRSTRTCGLRP